MVEENNIQNEETINGDKASGSDSESFEEMLDKSFQGPGRLVPGQKITTRVISVAGDLVYIDLGGKSDGVIDIEEFRDKEGVIQVKEGDEVDAYFISVQDGIRKLTTLVNGYSPAILTTIEDAFNAKLPVNGEVKREIKGGFEISMNGVRCFCPFSQIDLSGGREGGVYLGQTFPFSILEYSENGRNIVVSRRALLEEERKKKIAALKESLTEGMEVTGTVRSIHNFGAFVDLGGIDGMIPASEVSWDRSERPDKVLKVNQQTTAKILNIDWDKNRITLSIKALKPDPWASIAQKYLPDNKVNGTIVRLVPFGAFVNLEPGVDGLVHISNLGAGRRVNHPKEVVAVGQDVEAYVLVVDVENRKISLSLQPKPEPKRIDLPAIGSMFEGTVEKVMTYGVFVKLNEELTGLVPNAEMATPFGTDHSKMFPVGTKVKVIVKETDQMNAKVRLTRKGVEKKIERDEYKQYKESVKQDEEESSDGLGSLGKLLKAKMEEKGISIGQ